MRKSDETILKYTCFITVMTHPVGFTNRHNYYYGILGILSLLYRN